MLAGYREDEQERFGTCWGQSNGLEGCSARHGRLTLMLVLGLYDMPT